MATSTSSARPERILRVQIESLVAGIDGSEFLMTSESASVGSLINGFILERRLRPEIATEFAVQDAKGNVLKSHRSVESYALRDGEKLYLAKGEPRILFGCRNWFALATAAFLLAIVGYAVIIYLYARSGTIPFDYVVVIDAGSTHSDLYVYQWKGLKVRGTGVVEQKAMMRCDGVGLANYNDSTAAARSLLGCLNFANDQVPRDAWEKTDLYLGATAGMRMLNESNHDRAVNIMDAVRTEINGNYLFRYSAEHVRIITGIEEGVFGWITSNYLAKALLFDHIAPKLSYGALDLGGASTQITFESPTPSITAVARLFGEEYDLYSHSFLCYGLREAERRLKALLIQEQNSTVIQNPCTPLGNMSVERRSSIFGHNCTQSYIPQVAADSYTMNGTSDSAECGLQVSKLFNKTYCPYPYPAHCSFDGVYEPPLNTDFMAFSGYYFIMEFLNLTNDKTPGFVPLSSFREKTQDFCRKNWSEINILNASDPHSPYLTQYCFDAHFVDAVLTEGYGFNATTFNKIRFRKNIDGTDVGWTLGLALNATNTVDNEYPELLISTAVFISLMVIFTVLLIFAIAFFLRALKAARRHRDYEPLSTYGAI